MHPLPHSQALEQVGYDEATRVLRVCFRTGGRYDYLDVPRRVFDGLLDAEHPWTRWGRHITGSYRFRRVA
jgi:hypothetical protein